MKGETIKTSKKKKIDEWFFNLDDRVKEEIIDVLFPDDIIYDVDGNWNRLDWKIKLEIYKENN